MIVRKYVSVIHCREMIRSQRKEMELLLSSVFHTLYTATISSTVLETFKNLYGLK